MKVLSILKNLLPQFNSKQKLFTSNILGIGAGAVLYTFWQILFPLSADIPEYGLISRSVIIASSLFTIAVALQEEK